MKKALFLLAFILGTSLLLAQRNKRYDQTHLVIHDPQEREAYFSPSSMHNKYPLIEEQNYGWNSINKKWYQTDSIVYAYNAAGEIAEVVFYGWRGRKWKENKRYLHLYNPEGNLILYATQVWKKGIWRQQEGDEQELYKYNEQGQEIECLLQKWEGRKWKTYKRILKTYHEDTGLLKSMLYQIDEKGRGKFTNSVRREFLKYHENGILQSWTYQKWDSWEKEWGGISKFEETLNQDGQIDSVYKTTIKYGKVDEVIQNIYSYDDKKRLTEILAEKWNKKKEEWEVYTISRYTYDDENGIKIFEVFKVNEQTNLVEIKYQYIYQINEHNYLDNKTMMGNDKEGRLVKNSRYEYQLIDLEDSYKLGARLYKRWNIQSQEWVNYSLAKYIYRKLGPSNH